jgi:hypothetical protein
VWDISYIMDKASLNFDDSDWTSDLNSFRSSTQDFNKSTSLLEYELDPKLSLDKLHHVQENPTAVNNI